MSAALVLIDLGSQASFEFPFFPNEITSEDGANWEPQPTANGKKPLFYANGEPGTLTFPELWLDNTRTGLSLTPTIIELKSFTLDEQDDRGAPPALLAVWGDEKLRCVLKRASITRNYFDTSGNPLRAKVSLDLMEIQDEGEFTGVNVGI